MDLLGLGEKVRWWKGGGIKHWLLRILTKDMISIFIDKGLLRDERPGMSNMSQTHLPGLRHNFDEIGQDSSETVMETKGPSVLSFIRWFSKHMAQTTQYFWPVR